LEKIHPVANQAASFGQLIESRRGEPLLKPKFRKPSRVGDEYGVVQDRDRFDASLGHRGKSGLEVVRTARLELLQLYTQCPGRGVQLLQPRPKKKGMSSLKNVARWVTRGAASLSNSSRFAMSSGTKKVEPVMLPPGRAR